MTQRGRSAGLVRPRLEKPARDGAAESVSLARDERRVLRPASRVNLKGRLTGSESLTDRVVLTHRRPAVEARYTRLASVRPIPEVRGSVQYPTKDQRALRRARCTV